MDGISFAQLLDEGLLRHQGCAITQLKSYLREAAITLVPSLTDDQLQRITDQLNALDNPFLLVSRLSPTTALLQGIAVKAPSSHHADAITWDTVNTHIRAALSEPADAGTSVTAIDVRPGTDASDVAPRRTRSALPYTVDRATPP